MLIVPSFLENKTSTELLPLEQSLTMLESPISTVSFYECATREGMNVALDGITERAGNVLRANPWLGGWLVRGTGVGSSDGTHRLWHDPTGREMAPGIFRRASHDDVPLNTRTPYGEYEGILSSSRARNDGVTVRTNPEIANRRDEPLFRITVIADPPPDGSSEFALVVSMSHVCGDGHTFYRIYHMIAGNAPIVPLIPQRELSYGRRVMDLMGRKEAHYISHISTDPAWMKFFRLGSDGVSGGNDGDELRGRVFLVNRHWITSRKASYMIGGGREHGGHLQEHLAVSDDTSILGGVAERSESRSDPVDERYFGK